MDVCRCAVPPATVLLSTLSTLHELSHDQPPPNSTFSSANSWLPDTLLPPCCLAAHQTVQSYSQERVSGEPGPTKWDLIFLNNLTEKLHGRPTPRSHEGLRVVPVSSGGWPAMFLCVNKHW